MDDDAPVAADDDTDVAARLDACVDAAEHGGEKALGEFRSNLAVEAKSGDPLDAVTAVDRAVQREVFEHLRAAYPDDTLVGEEDEALKAVPERGAAWVVDPIDGTNNYVAGNRVWATSVACCLDGEPVAAANVMPATGDSYVAGDDGVHRDGEPATVSDRSDPETFTINPIFGQSRRHKKRLMEVVRTVLAEFGDLRRAGCAQAALSSVASGELEAAVSTVELNDWDTVAGVHLVRQAGGRVTDVRGNRWTPGATGLVASNDEAHDALVAAVKPDE